jgi:FKBP-type peptidyl-prolyl cis-trans isomerase FklB
MKYFAVVVLALGLMLTSCSKKTGSAEMKTLTDSVSYAIGFDFGKNLKAQDVDLNADIVAQAIKDAKDTSIHLMTDVQIKSVMASFQKEVMQKQEEKNKAQGEKNKADGAKFLSENKSKAGVVVLPSGLQYKVITMGNGPKPKENQMVVVNYRGTLIDGTEFDNSYKRGEPATFPVKGIIKGFTEALQLMPIGSKWQLFIPADLAYGERAAGPQIAPFATLIFEVELLDAKAMPEGAHQMPPGHGARQ